MRRRSPPTAAALVGAMVLGLGLAPPASATVASSTQVARLAAAARRDSAALARLRSVDRVDGRRVDIAASLRGAGGRALDERLAVLAAQGGAPPPTAGGAPGARGRARSIVTQARFQPARVPQPLRRPLDLAAAALERAFAWLSARLPGGRATAWALLAAPVVLVSFLVAARLARRRERGGLAVAQARGTQRAKSAAQLQREAEDAERLGELDRALRLYFGAGLLRLDRARAIALSPSLTTGQVSRRLRSDQFDELRGAFEAVAYGGRSAGGEEVAAAREVWPRVLAEVTR